VIKSSNTLLQQHSAIGLFGGGVVVTFVALVATLD